MRSFLLWMAVILGFVTSDPAMSPEELDAKASIEAAHVMAYYGLVHHQPKLPPPLMMPDVPPVAPDLDDVGVVQEIETHLQSLADVERRIRELEESRSAEQGFDVPGIEDSESRGPVSWTIDKMLGVVVRGFDIWLENRGYSGEMDRVVSNARRLNNALDAFADHPQFRSVLADHGPPEAKHYQRQRIKIIVYAMDDCDSCKMLDKDAWTSLPKVGWDLVRVDPGTKLEDILNGFADIAFIHEPRGTESHTKYPTIEIYIDGKLHATQQRVFTANEVADWFLAEYNR